jgi:hypothetical protein
MLISACSEAIHETEIQQGINYLYQPLQTIRIIILNRMPHINEQ